jgi:co-chaperonin GroES (HSP10)
MLGVRGNRVLVKPEDQSVTERDSGIVTIEHYAPEVIGTIVACGDVVDVKVDDVVLFPPSAGQVVEHENERYLVLTEDELIAVLEETHG